MGNTACILLNYNDSDTTVAILDSIKDYDALDEIVIVDNKSPDNSFERLKGYSSSKVHVIQSQRNGGYGYGNNFGIRYAINEFGAQYVLIANPDVLFSNEFVVNLKRFIDNNEDCAIVSGIQEGPNPPAWKDTNLFGDICFNNMLLNKILRPRYYPDSYFASDDPVEVYAVPGCLLLARCSALFEVGFYDEEFFLFEEEKVLAKKFKELGWKSYIVTSEKYVHNHSVTIKKNIKTVGKAKSIVLKSNELYLKKYCGVDGPSLLLVRVMGKIALIEDIVYALVKSAKII